MIGNPKAEEFLIKPVLATFGSRNTCSENQQEMRVIGKHGSILSLDDEQQIIKTKETLIILEREKFPQRKS